MAGLATASTADGATLVFAATSAGVYRSSDHGRTWSLPNSGVGVVPFVEIVAPSHNFGSDHTLFAGGTGVYRSVDGGIRWAHMLSGGHVTSLVVASSNERECVVFAGTELDGIVRSEDGGRTWASGNAGLLDLTVLAIGVSPEFGRDQPARGDDVRFCTGPETRANPGALSTMARTW